MLGLVLLFILQAPAQPSSSASQPAADNAQEAFVIEQHVTKQRFESDGTGRRETVARVKVQSDAGVQMWGQLVFGYSAGTERLEIQYVRVRKADGTSVTAPLESAVQDLTSPVQQVAPVYTDFRQKHVTVPGLRPGETLEYAIVTTIHTPLAAGHFWSEYDFQREAIVLDEQLEFDVPASRTVTLKTAPDATPQVTEAGGRRIYRWTSSHKVREKEKDEATLEAEAEAEAENPRRAAVRMTTFQSWDEVGRWYAGLEKSSRAVTPEIRRKAEELTAGRKTDLEKFEALYDFVAPGFRYVSISLGMGRYQPRVAADVLRDQYGDCKDKHTLLAALLEAVGLRASTVLIHSETKLDASFPSPSQFDHVITTARVDGTDVWVDVTTEVAPFRLLSANLRKKQALVVSTADGSRVLDTPADPPVLNTTTQEIRGTLGALGSFTGDVKLSVRGDIELLLRVVFHRTPEAQWKTVLERFNDSAGIGGEIGEYKVSDPRNTHAPLQIEYKVSKTGFVDWTKKTARLKLPYSGFPLPELGEKVTRDIELGSPMRIDYRLELQLGDGYKGRVPVPVSLKRDYATYEGTYVLDGQRFTATRRLHLQTGTLAPERAGDFRSFRRTVVADNEQPLTLEIAAAASDAAAPDLKASELVSSGYDAIQSRNYPQAVTLLKRALELEPKNTRGWNYLGTAHTQMRQYAEALAAYESLLKVNPYDEFVHNQIGFVHRNQRRYAEAEAAFRKQLELNPLDKFAHASLGAVLVDMKKYDAAVPQIEKAISLQPDDSALHVELGTAYLNLSKNDEALAAFGKAAELSSEPTTWNNIAYQLALKGAHLDRALQYAESAVASAAAASRNFSVDHVSARELSVVRSLASYWDTLGWVYFAKGDMTRAERLVSASWALEQSSEVGEHLAQIYEKQGRKADAIRMYAMAVNGDRPVEAARERLTAIAGTGAEALILNLKQELVTVRSFPVEAPKGSAGTADFVVLIGESGAVEAVKFVSGDERLRSLDAALRKITFGPALPDVAPAKVLRRGALGCSASGCTFVLVPASHANTVQ